jgi:hypothetical protein
MCSYGNLIVLLVMRDCYRVGMKTDILNHSVKVSTVCIENTENLYSEPISPWKSSLIYLRSDSRKKIKFQKSRIIK